MRASIDREFWARVTGWGLEAGLYAAVAVTTLLYSARFSDNVLAKGGVLLVMAGLLSALSAGRATIEGRVRLPRLPVFLPFLCLTTWMAICAALSDNRMLGLESLLLQAAPFCLFLVVVQHRRSARAVDRLLGVVVLVSSVVSAMGVLQYLGVDPLPGPGVYGRAAISTLGNPNFAAYYQNLILPVLVALLLSQWTRLTPLRRTVLGLATALSVFHLIAAGSRAGWFSAGVGFVLLLSLLSRSRSWSRRAPGLILMALLVLPIAQVFLQSVPVGRQETLYDSTTRIARATWERALTAFDAGDLSRHMRVLIWQDTLDMIADAPIAGVGPGQYWRSLAPYIDRLAWGQMMAARSGRPVEPRHAHNEYLEFSAELGLVGLAILLWLLGGLLWLGVRYLRPRPGREGTGLVRPVRAISAGVVCGIAATLVHAQTGFNLHHPVVTMHLWLLAGAMVALHNRRLGGGDRPLDLPLHTTARAASWGAAGLGLAVVFGWTGLRVLMGDYYFEQGHHLQAARRPVEAILALGEASAWRGYEFQYPRELGQVALQQGREAEARTALERSLQLQPHDAGALRLLGGVLIRQGDPSAVQVLSRAVARDRSSARAYALLAQAHRQAGHPDSAVAALERALRDLPRQPELLMALALACRDSGELERALTLLEEGAGMAPGDGRLAGNLGALYLEVGRGAQAEAQLRRALQFDPGNGMEWLANLGQALALQGRHDEALVAAAQALRLAPEDSRLQELNRSIAAREAQGP